MRERTKFDVLKDGEWLSFNLGQLVMLEQRTQKSVSELYNQTANGNLTLFTALQIISVGLEDCRGNMPTEKALMEEMEKKIDRGEFRITNLNVTILKALTDSGVFTGKKQNKEVKKE